MSIFTFYIDQFPQPQSTTESHLRVLCKTIVRKALFFGRVEEMSTIYMKMLDDPHDINCEKQS